MMYKYIIPALAVLVFVGVAVWATRSDDTLDEQDQCSIDTDYDDKTGKMG